MVKISPKKQVVSTGVIIELSSEAATHLSYALSCFNKGQPLNQHHWPWLTEFIEQLDKARGSGCTMGGRLAE